jgi:hypothetical protein
MALTGIGVGGLAAAEATKEWDNSLGKALQTLKPVFTTMTAFGGLLLTVPPIIRGIKVAIDTLKASMIALRAATIGVQGAFGLLTLGVGMIGAGIYLLATHGRHLKEVTQDTDRWTKALDSANDRLRVLESNGQGATREAEILRDTIEGLTTALSEFNSVGEDNKVTTYNLEDAYRKLSEAQQAVISYEQTLAADEAAGRDATEFGRQQMELRRTLIADTYTDIVELTAGIEALKQAERDEAKAVRDDFVKDLEAYYGFREDAQKSLVEQAEDAADASRDSLNDQMEAARRAHDYIIGLAQDEYDRRVKVARDGADAEIKELQRKLNIIDSQQTYSNRRYEDSQAAKQEADLREAVSSAWNREDRARAEEDLADFLEERSKKLSDRKLEDSRTNLQNEINAIQESADNAQAIYDAELEAVKTAEDNKLDAIETRIDTELSLLESALNTKRGLLQQEFDDAVAAQNAIMNNALANIETVFAAQEIAATAPTTEVHAALLRYKASRAAAGGSEYAGGGISGGLANGGPILEPTLLTGLRTGQRRIAGEAGPEYVVPAGKMGGDINISGPFYIREEADIPKLAQELHRLRMIKGNFGG